VTSARSPLEPGAPAPEIDLPEPDGTRWLLSDARGRPVVLIFHRHLH
jgi:peroxiredoxin